MAPKSTAGRVAAVLYGLACIGVLALAITGSSSPDNGIVIAYAMLFLSFPAGFLVAAAISAIGYVLYETSGIIIPGSMAYDILAVVAFAAVGYAQWFIAVPWLYRKLKVPSNNSLERP